LRIIGPVVESHALEIVDARIAQGQGRSQVRVVLDTPQGDGRITVDQCARVSREIGHNLDAEDLIPGPYMLEVCSPGVDRTLGREKDFVRAIGQRVKIETRIRLEGKRRFQGELIEFAAGTATVRTEAGDFRIPFDRIVRAQTIYPLATPLPKRGQ